MIRVIPSQLHSPPVRNCDFKLRTLSGFRGHCPTAPVAFFRRLSNRQTSTSWVNDHALTCSTTTPSPGKQPSGRLKAVTRTLVLHTRPPHKKPRTEKTPVEESAAVFFQSPPTARSRMTPNLTDCGARCFGPSILYIQPRVPLIKFAAAAEGVLKLRGNRGGKRKRDGQEREGGGRRFGGCGGKVVRLAVIWTREQQRGSERAASAPDPVTWL